MDLPGLIYSAHQTNMLSDWMLIQWQTCRPTGFVFRHEVHDRVQHVVSFVCTVNTMQMQMQQRMCVTTPGKTVAQKFWVNIAQPLSHS